MPTTVDPLGDGFAVQRLAVASGSVSTVPILPVGRPVNVIRYLC